MKYHHFQVFLLPVLLSCSTPSEKNTIATEGPVIRISSVTLKDAFWSPKLNLWQRKTVNDVFDKFEGKYTPSGQYLERDFKAMKTTRNAFLNFDLVTEGKRGIGVHHGPPWYDGLIYETIRGSADLLKINPDPALSARIDGYIGRIEKAQNSEPDGYINTYTQLMEPGHRWGFNGGMQRWQHDVYNAGMLVEAGVHYYKATGKFRLLNVAVKMANLMVSEMGPAPKKNVVPAHSGPEEALIKLYHLFQDEPELKQKMSVPVNEQEYYQLVIFWIEARGHHAGLPLWNTWGDEKSEKWIRDKQYTDAKYGNHSRPSWGDYAQDSIPVLEQKTIVGHAVRATLLATGLTTVALDNKDQRYRDAATGLWDNMVGKRMFITGGVGAIAKDEKFGNDYYLPNEAYLETCAAVGAGFFSERMNALTGKGQYIDELERTLYNGVLTGISLPGDHYTYQNPLIASQHTRWEWHDCPCCPPMFLKIMAAIPDFTYGAHRDGVAINLFVANEAEIAVGENQVHLRQETNYPWDGRVLISVTPEREDEFAIKIRVPGWARGAENPFGLYQSKTKAGASIKINGSEMEMEPVDGYVIIRRTWKKSDQIELTLPTEPRWVWADERVKELHGMATLAAGPLVYSFEAGMNTGFENMTIDPAAAMEVIPDSRQINGVNIISGKDTHGVTWNAIPYYAVGNLLPGGGYRVWQSVVGSR